MTKVTSKLQLTLPKRLAERYGIAPGDDAEFAAACDIIHLIPADRPRSHTLSPQQGQRLFDEHSARQREREKHMKLPAEPPRERYWRREDLYTRDESGSESH